VRGIQDGLRIRIECHHHARPAHPPRQMHRRSDQPLVRAMNAVEHADRHDGA
jgi:hypothetical protein